MFSLLGWLYGKIADSRNALYDRGVFTSYSLGAKTISVGNITAGGTGKTPLVAFVAEILAERGETVCILSRGYGRENARARVLVSDGENVLADAWEGGDEPVELAQKLLGKAIVVADADRVSASKWALKEFGVTAFVIDDGFQHRRAKRDLDIVCIDATNPFGNGKMLPAGILREPLRNLQRADATVITRANLAENIEDLKFRTSKLNPDSPLFLSGIQILGLHALEKFFAKTQSSQRQKPISNPDPLQEMAVTLPTKSGFAFCALGNPDNFFKQLQQDGFDLSGAKALPDHHFYQQKDVDLIQKTAYELGAACLLTTAKDAVKLKGLNFDIPCLIVEIEMVFDDADAFRALVNASW